MKAEIVPSPDRFEGEPELNKCISLSATAWLGKIDGETACIWGLIPPSILSEQAYLWLFTTELVESHKFMFVRWSQRFLEVMHKDYPVIVGHCEIGNARAMSWIKWLGGKFGEPQGKKIPFVIRKPTNG